MGVKLLDTPPPPHVHLFLYQDKAPGMDRVPHSIFINSCYMYTLYATLKSICKLFARFHSQSRFERRYTPHQWRKLHRTLYLSQLAGQTSEYSSSVRTGLSPSSARYNQRGFRATRNSAVRLVSLTWERRALLRERHRYCLRSSRLPNFVWSIIMPHAVDLVLAHCASCSRASMETRSFCVCKHASVKSEAIL